MYSWSLLGRSPQTAQTWKVCPASNPAGTSPCHLLSSGPVSLNICHAATLSGRPHCLFPPSTPESAAKSGRSPANKHSRTNLPSTNVAPASPADSPTSGTLSTCLLRASFSSALAPRRTPLHRACQHLPSHRTLHVDVLLNVASR